MEADTQYTTAIPANLLALQNVEKLFIRATGYNWDGSSRYAVSGIRPCNHSTADEHLFDISVPSTEDSASIIQVGNRDLVFQCKDGLLDHKQTMAIYLPAGEIFAEVSHNFFRSASCLTRFTHCESRNRPMLSSFILTKEFRTVFKTIKSERLCVSADMVPIPRDASLHDKVMVLIVLFKLYYSFYKQQSSCSDAHKQGEMTADTQYTTTIPASVSVLQNVEKLFLRARGFNYDGSSYYAVSGIRPCNHSTAEEDLFDISVPSTEDSASIIQVGNKELVFQCKNGLLDPKQTMAISLPTGEIFAEVNRNVFRSACFLTLFGRHEGSDEDPLSSWFVLTKEFETVFKVEKLDRGCVLADMGIVPRDASLHDKVMVLIVLFKLYYSFYKQQSSCFVPVIRGEMKGDTQFTSSIPASVLVLQDVEKLSIRATGSNCNGISCYAVSAIRRCNILSTDKHLFDISVPSTEDSASIIHASNRELVFQCKNGLLDPKQTMTISLPTGEIVAEVNRNLFRSSSCNTRFGHYQESEDNPLSTWFIMTKEFKTVFQIEKLDRGCVSADMGIVPSDASLHDKVMVLIMLFKLYHSFYKQQPSYCT